MADMSAISGAMVSLKVAGDIAKGLLQIRDVTMVQGEAVKLYAEILSAQQGALAANSAQFALLERVRELEAEVAKVKAWDTEKQRYELAEVGLGSLAYRLKPEAQGAEPPHSICPSCYQHGEKAILQHDSELGFELLRCHACKASLRVKSKPMNLVW